MKMNKLTYAHGMFEKDHPALYTIIKKNKPEIRSILQHIICLFSNILKKQNKTTAWIRHSMDWSVCITSSRDCLQFWCTYALVALLLSVDSFLFQDWRLRCKNL